MAEQSKTSLHSPKIVRLTEMVINQIAAGEVIERPASVIKEVVENAIDAESRRIEIRLKDGGKTEITVIDDGCGMVPQDLKLSIERHATSKIAVASDLERLGTFGFRGEALSSIASVAELEIRSRTKEMPCAYVLRVTYGEAESDLRPVGAAFGTAVTTKNLFLRTPARHKFLRSSATELSHCTRTVKEIALGSPSVSISLYHDDHLLSQYAVPGREGRVQECLKPRWKPLCILEQGEEINLEAFLSPGHWVQDRGELFLFINGRPVRNRDILAAVRRSYLDTLGAHHEPSGAVYLDLRPDWVDVNVHPQKLEVRCFRQERIYPWLVSSIRKAIAKDQSVRIFAPPSTAIQPPILPETAAGDTLSALRNADSVASPRSVYLSRPTSLPSSLQREDFSDESATARASDAPSVEVSLADNGGSLRYLGQAKASYLVCEDAEGLVIVDQHALHEKLRFERLKAGFKEGRISVQRLLVPKIIHIPTDLEPVLQESLTTFERLGFDIECFGDGDVAVKAQPDLLEESQTELILMEALRALKAAIGMEEESLDHALHSFFATLACHSVVRANQKMSEPEAQRLLQSLDELKEGWTCPHGRPVLFRIDYHSIDKHFERA